MLSKLCVFLCAAGIQAEPNVLVGSESTDYRIYHRLDAPASVKESAAEIQRVLAKATGVKLAIVTKPSSPMIALGDSRPARDAGLDGKAMEYESFRILSRGRDIFIAGNDTPDGKEKWNWHVSRGTYFGACSFLQRVAGVRWLMPGELGEDVPTANQITFGNLDITGKPTFRFRALAYVQGRNVPEVMQWKRRHKINEWYYLSFGHSFDNHPSREVLLQHPEYMPLLEDGTRQPVPENMKLNHKYCLTNPDLIHAFGESVADLLSRNPERYHASLSLSDGMRFCKCERCEKHVIRDDRGHWGSFAERGWSMTSAVLKFYNGVARLVGQKHPDRIVGGLVYNAYTYPPDEITRVEKNLVLDVAVLDHYGFKLYKPDRAAEFRRLFPAWSKFTGNLAVTDYSTWMRDWYGLPVPPGREILKLTFPAYEKYVPLFVNYTGHAAWGVGALHNYMVARLLWEPGLDVDSLYDEFLTRAYGKGAPYIEKIYSISEDIIAAYVRAHPGFRKPDYDVSYRLVTEYYAPRFTEFETLYAKARAAAESEPQRKRIEMFGDCLKLLHYNLRCAGFVQAPEKSLFYLTHDDFKKFMVLQKGLRTLAPQQKPQKGKPLKILFARESRILKIPRIPIGTKAPMIDGKLDEPAWKAAGVAQAFRRRGIKLEAKEQTKARLMYDVRYLYLGITCMESEITKAKSRQHPHDSFSLFEDETVEVFFSRVANVHRYWQVAMNPSGAYFDSFQKKKEHELKSNHAAVISKDRWTIELKIPFDVLGFDNPPEGQKWHGNFCRSRRAGNGEVSSWSIIEQGFHEPESFGTWVFEGAQ
ncbi:MAG: DUF4838 domain-containing protein [Planctomycetota bacterium]|nr:DUF4838 domain-containing protein [Planctomycetota bacterium]